MQYSRIRALQEDEDINQTYMEIIICQSKNI